MKTRPLTIDDLFQIRNFFSSLINNISTQPLSASTLSLLEEQVNLRLAEIALEHSPIEACSCRSLFRELLNDKFAALSQGKKPFYDVLFTEETQHVSIN